MSAVVACCLPCLEQSPHRRPDCPSACLSVILLSLFHSMIDAMLAAGIKPYATIFHWDLPQVRLPAATGTCRRRSLPFAACCLHASSLAASIALPHRPMRVLSLLCARIAHTACTAVLPGAGGLVPRLPGGPDHRRLRQLRGWVAAAPCLLCRGLRAQQQPWAVTERGRLSTDARAAPATASPPD